MPKGVQVRTLPLLLMPSRLMVGHHTLNVGVEVRSLGGQPDRRDRKDTIGRRRQLQTVVKHLDKLTPMRV